MISSSYELTQFHFPKTPWYNRTYFSYLKENAKPKIPLMETPHNTPDQVLFLAWTLIHSTLSSCLYSNVIFLTRLFFFLITVCPGHNLHTPHPIPQSTRYQETLSTITGNSVHQDLDKWEIITKWFWLGWKTSLFPNTINPIKIAEG